MTTPEIERRPAALWKAMTDAQRRAAAEAFWADDESLAEQTEVMLLLDEPTNDLDVDMLRALEEAVLDFGGCAVVISHDRWFLDRVATHILAWEGDADHPARWFWYEGNFEAYEKNKIDRLGADAARPHRVTYRKLTRD